MNGKNTTRGGRLLALAGATASALVMVAILALSAAGESRSVVELQLAKLGELFDGGLQLGATLVGALPLLVGLAVFLLVCAFDPADTAQAS